MKRINMFAFFGMVLLLSLPTMAFADPDDYICDTAIYGGSTATLQHNVLIILDTSGSMDDPAMPVASYDPAATYPDASACGGQPCVDETVYKCTAFGLECGNWTAHVDDVASVTNDCGRADPQWILMNLGKWNSSRNRLTTAGECARGNGIYATGHWIKYRDQSLATGTPEPKIDHAKDALAGADGLLNTTSGVNFGLMVFDQNGSSGGQFLELDVDSSSYASVLKRMTDQHTATTTNQEALISVINSMVADGWTPLAESLFEANRYYAGEASAFGHSGSYMVDSKYVSPIEGSCQNNYVVLITDGMSTQDVDGVLDDICVDGDCDGDGFEPDDDPDKSYPNSGSDYLDDVAKYMYERDFADFEGLQNVITYTIGFGLSGGTGGAVKLIEETAENGRFGGFKDELTPCSAEGVDADGNADASCTESFSCDSDDDTVYDEICWAKFGSNEMNDLTEINTQEAYLVNNNAELQEAFSQILGEIFAVDTSFVAPVVPISPENKTYSGNRVYLGFFKPQQSADWLGNLKKFALDSNGKVVDKNGDVAIGEVGTADEGLFLDSSVSFWNDLQDSASVDSGGVGERLKNRNDLDPSGVNKRKIYTYTATLDGSSNLITDLTDSANVFDLTIAPEEIGLVAGDTAGRDTLVKYIYGLNSYADDPDIPVTSARDWVLGDILHSKPAIVSYNTYTTDEDLTDDSNTHYENTCPGNWASDFNNVNKTVIYVGSNDGMLHAFRDCDGEELWSFIPQDVLPKLSELHDATHSYFIDAAPTIYRYDKSLDGNIGSGPTGDDGSDDKVFMIIGQRRGGGVDTNPGTTFGSYYALDVTNPVEPEFLWKIDRTTTGFSELGETWSQPVLGKIKVTSGGTTVDKIVAFITAGYDNLNEDGRFGNTQTFSDSSVVPPTADAEYVTSTGAVVAGSLTNTPKGRGVYAIEVATLDANGVPTFATSPNLVWDFTYDATDSFADDLTYSFVSDVAAIDTDFDGYTDRLYVGDTGGRMWRFSSHYGYPGGSYDGLPYADSHVANWIGKIIFSANPGNEATPTNGRKIYYRPSVVLETTYIGVFFGTGDRSHPLNRSVMDRIYAIKDQGQEHLTVNDSVLEDLTENKLQDPSTPLGAAAVDGTCTATEQAVQCIQERLNSLSNYGWYVSLDRQDADNDHLGEKILSSVLAFNGVLYATSFTSEALVYDPCKPGNLGTGRLYAMKYIDATAVMNLSDDNGDDLEREDRSRTIGVGIPSAPVPVLPKEGDAYIIAGAGGGIMWNVATPGGLIKNLYWRQK